MTKVAEHPRLADLDYRVVKGLGAGAGSTILLIADKKLGGKYALKVVKRQDAEDDIYIAQALHEYDVAQQLNHPSLLKIYDCRTKKLLVPGRRRRAADGVRRRPDARRAGSPERGQLVLLFIHVASA